MTPGPLPSHGTILSSLIASISKSSCFTHEQSNGMPRQISQEASIRELRSVMLTLHVLFPNLVLPALDLIDRRLVDKFRVGSDVSAGTEIGPVVTNNQGLGQTWPSQTSQTSQNNKTSELGHNEPSVYAVRPFSSTSLRLTATETRAIPKTHIVHLTAWNCSCTSFAIAKYCSRRLNDAQFNCIHSALACGLEWSSWNTPRSVTFVNSDSLPSCKHLLACLLVERCGHLFADSVVNKIVSDYGMAAFLSAV